MLLPAVAQVMFEQVMYNISEQSDSLQFVILAFGQLGRSVEFFVHTENGTATCEYSTLNLLQLTGTSIMLRWLLKEVHSLVQKPFIEPFTSVDW